MDDGKSTLKQRWSAHATRLKNKITILGLALRHPDTPWIARLMAGLVLAYAFSPLDLIPDPIPVLGMLDDLVLLPLGIWLTLKLIPAQVWAECEEMAERGDVPISPIWKGLGLLLVICLWGVMFFALWQLVSATTHVGTIGQFPG